MADDREFFAALANAPYFVHLDDEQHRALGDIRSALRRAAPRYAAPEQTVATISDWMELDLVIRHASDPLAWIELSFGDGYLLLSWPGGKEHGGWNWKPGLGAVVEALLSGRNLQTIYRRAGRVVAVDTETWDEQGIRRRLSHRLRLRAILLWPFALRAERRSLSFDRAPAFRSEQ